jgi:asparagine N-glycosylation enzyme membrane subunit Stt3
MFTPGRTVFALVFIVVFVVILAVAYRKDIAYLRANYKGVWQVLALILLFLVAFVWVKRLVIRP